MGDYLVQNVSFETAKKSEPQTPQVLPSTEVQGKWESWKMN
jgi:hypothetical protein